MSCSHVVADEVARGNFEDTGPDRDWGDRNEALLALQRLFDEAAKIEQTDDEAMFDAEAWRALRGCRCSSVCEIRGVICERGVRLVSKNRPRV